MKENLQAQINAWSRDNDPLGCVDALRQIGRMVDVQDLSAVMGISSKQVYALACRGAIPHYRIGRAVRFDPTEIAEWLRAHSCGRRA